MEVQGRIKLIGTTQTFGVNGFQKRELVVMTEEQYPQPIVIEFIQEKCSLLDNYQIGQLVKVGINLRGREWTNPQGEVKYFNSLQGWRIEYVQVAPQPTEPAPAPMAPASPSDAFEPYSANNTTEEDFDDLPF